MAQRLNWNGREINGWVCDGKELKPKFGATNTNTWILDGAKMKPKFGATNANTWDVGNAPILVIAGAVVLHLY